MKKSTKLIQMSYKSDIRIIEHFIRVVSKYFPDKKISGYYIAILYKDIPLLEYGHGDHLKQKSLCFQKVLNTTRNKLIINHKVHPGSLGVYFVGFGEPLDKAIEVILGHYFFYRHVLETKDILKKIWSIKGYGENKPVGQIAFKFLHEYNEDE